VLLQKQKRQRGRWRYETGHGKLQEESYSTNKLNVKAGIMRTRASCKLLAAGRLGCGEWGTADVRLGALEGMGDL
jgi:hypothetical protein